MRARSVETPNATRISARQPVSAGRTKADVTSHITSGTVASTIAER